MKRDWKAWTWAAVLRAVRTFAEAMLAYIGTGAIVMGDVHWSGAISAGCLGAVSAVLLALAGLPEAGEAPVKQEKNNQYPES